MKIMLGAFFLALVNKSRTRLAPTPTNISTKSEPEIEKNGTFASPATARASKVLPVPGGPSSKTPEGILAPNLVNLAGFFKNSTTSTNSCFSSSSPATSENRTLFFLGSSGFTCDRPKFIMPPLPPRPPLLWLNIIHIITIKRMVGTNITSVEIQLPDCDSP